MSSAIRDDTQSRRITSYRFTMFALAALIVAVAITTIMSTASSTAKTIPVKAAPRLAANNDVVNPEISVSCLNPVITLALVLDRSGSIYANDPGDPALYKKTVNDFLDTLSSQMISRNGKVNVLLYAFGSRSVNQNKTTSSNQMITAITDTASLDDMKDAVNKIWFSQPNALVSDKNHNGSIDDIPDVYPTPNPNPDEYYGMVGSNEPYDIRRGYNPNSYEQGNYSMTNWDDALTQVANIGKSAYANPAKGKHIDLALVLTDGDPNVNNGSDGVFSPSDLSGYSSAQGRIYAQNTVKELRQGTSNRPPMAVRGVLINSDKTSAMDEVFGTGSDNYSTAGNFESDLKDELQNIINSIENDEVCQFDYVEPGISVQVNPDNVTVEENGDAKYVTMKITNTSIVKDKNGVVKNVVPKLTGVTLTIGGQTYNVGNLEQDPITHTVTIKVSLGEAWNSPKTTAVSVEGHFAEYGKFKLAPNGTSAPKGSAQYVVTVKPADLPA